MAALVWKHGTTAERAKETIEAELRQRGQADKVKWNGDEFSVSVGFGVVLNLVGRVTDEAIVVEKCTGAMAGFAMDKAREHLPRVFPGGAN